MRARIKKSPIQRLGEALLVLFLVTILIGLGLWQLDRANEMRNPAVVPIDRTIYPLTELTTPTGTIPPTSVGKQVRTAGNYIANFKAPNQIDGNGKVSDWEVALLQTRQILQFLRCADYGKSGCNHQKLQCRPELKSLAP